MIERYSVISIKMSNPHFNGLAAQWEDVIVAVNPNVQKGIVGATSPPYHETGNKIPSGSITEWKNKTGEWRTGMRYSDNPSNIGNLKDKKRKID